jgi:hypothetical protein
MATRNEANNLQTRLGAHKTVIAKLSDSIFGQLVTDIDIHTEDDFALATEANNIIAIDFITTKIISIRTSAEVGIKTTFIATGGP